MRGMGGVQKKNDDFINVFSHTKDETTTIGDFIRKIFTVNGNFKEIVRNDKWNQQVQSKSLLQEENALLCRYLVGRFFGGGRSPYPKRHEETGEPNLGRSPQLPGV